MMFVIATDSSSYELQGRVSVTVSRSLDSMAGSFTIEQSLDMERAEYLYPDLGMGKEVRIYLDGKLALTGIIDKREGRGDADSYRITITGRSKTGLLVDGSVEHKTGQIDKRKPNDVIDEIVKPFGITVRHDKRSEELMKRFIIRDGETAERAIRRVAREHGLIPTDDEEGNLVVAEIGKDNGQSFILGVNILEWTASQDMKVRHSKVIAKGQAITDDHAYGRPAIEIAGAAVDEGVRHHKPLIIPFWGDGTIKRAEKRALIEVLRRQGESINVRLTVPGFTDVETGQLYRPNVLHHVSIPVDGVDNILLCKSLTFRLTPTEARTELELVPEKAFADGEAESKGKAKGGKSAAKRKKGGKARKASRSGSGTSTPATPADDSRLWYDAFEQAKKVKLD